MAPGLDPARVPALAAALARAMRAAGVPCSPEHAVRLGRALRLAPPADRSGLYWTARAVLVSGPEHVEAFDAVFATVFQGASDPAAAGRGDPLAPSIEQPPGEPGTPQPGARDVEGAGRGSPRFSGVGPQDGPDAGDPPREVPLGMASPQERLRGKDFASLGPGELLALRRLMRELELATPLRRTRRTRRSARGESPDLRATLRASRRTAGDPVRQIRRRRRMQPRRLVVLCDISGSMEAYSRAFLQFLHGAVGAADAEAFVFATRLTRVTRALRGARPDEAITRAARAAPDWSGGTRIGVALQRFNDLHGRRGMARGAVVVIVSDGWEREDPALVGREMERLSRLAHRIVWVNPRKAAPGFAPVAGGMAAALPHCDALVPGHSLEGLAEAVAAIRDPG